MKTQCTNICKSGNRSTNQDDFKIINFLKGYHPLSPVSYKIATSLLNGLDGESLKILASMAEDSFIRYRIKQMMKDCEQKNRNTPVRELLSLYTDKKSGMVAKSRDELFRRFPYLDTNLQKRIVEAFLNGPESDATKMSKYLMRHWDDMYSAQIKKAWLNKPDNAYLSSLVIRYQDLSFVQEHLSQLRMFDGPMLASRLCQAGEMPKVDEWQLTDYLAIIHKGGAVIDEDEAIELMYSYLVCAASQDIETGRVPDYTYKSDIGHPSLIFLEGARLIVYYLGRMGFTQALSKFETIDSELCSSINVDIQQYLSNDELNNEEKITAIWKDFCSSVVALYDKPGRMPVLVKHNVDSLPCINYGRGLIPEEEPEIACDMGF